MTQQPPNIQIDSIHVGTPQTYTGPDGVWRSAIYRERVSEPVLLELTGLAGDEVADKVHHGWPNMAVCCHTLDDYAFWNQQLDLDLQPGGVGENWTLRHAYEDEICLLDIYDVGTARVQVSKPRTPCRKQGRRVGRSDWVRLVIQELRTGFYLQVLQAGIVQAGDTWRLVARPHPGVTLKAVNRCVYQAYDPALAEQLGRMAELDAFWQERLTQARDRATLS